MNNEGWVRIFDRLPKIAEEVEVEDYQGKIYKTKLLAEGSLYRWNIDIKGANLWRPVSEKKPDFSKLKEKDLVVINEEIVGIFLSFTQEDSTQKNISLKMACSFKSNDFMPFKWINIDNIKKITRINIENQTFEEI